MPNNKRRYPIQIFFQRKNILEIFDQFWTLNFAIFDRSVDLCSVQCSGQSCALDCMPNLKFKSLTEFYEDVFTLKQSHQILNAGKKRKYVGECLRNPFFCLLKIYHTGVQLIYTHESKQVSNFWFVVLIENWIIPMQKHIP